MSRRYLVLTGLLAAITSLLTLSATPASAATIPPLSGFVTATDPDSNITGACHANLAEYTNSGTTSSDTYALWGYAANSVVALNSVMLSCWIPGDNQIFSSPNLPEATYGAGVAQVWQSTSSTHLTVCMSFVMTAGTGGGKYYSPTWCQ